MLSYPSTLAETSFNKASALFGDCAWEKVVITNANTNSPNFFILFFTSNNNTVFNHFIKDSMNEFTFARINEIRKLRNQRAVSSERERNPLLGDGIVQRVMLDIEENLTDYNEVMEDDKILEGYFQACVLDFDPIINSERHKRRGLNKYYIDKAATASLLGLLEQDGELDPLSSDMLDIIRNSNEDNRNFFNDIYNANFIYYW